MKQPSSRRPRALPALLGLGVVASSMLGITPVAAPANAAGEPVQLVLAPANGGVAQPGADVTISAAVTNTGSATIDASTLQVALDREVISTRAELAEWLTPPTGESTVDSDAIITTVAVPALQPGEEHIVQAVIPAADVTLTAWGVRGITGTVERADGTESVTHSSIVYNGRDAPDRTQVAVAIPITTQPGQTGLIPEATLATITADNGLLTRELDSVIGRPVGILIDPRIIVSIRALGSAAPSSATDWLDRLKGASNPIYPLSYADADVAAMSQAGAPQILAPTSFDYALDPANFTGSALPTASPAPVAGTASVDKGDDATNSPAPTPSPTPNAVPDTSALLAWNYTGTSIAWPRDNTVAPNDVPYFAGNGLTTSILSSSNVSLASGEPAAGVVRSGDSTVLVSDDTVSRALRDAAGALTATDRQRSLSDLASSLAVVASEDGGTPPTILATLDRAAPADGTALADALTSLDSLTWSSTTSFDGFAAQAPTTEAAVVDQPEPAERTGPVAAMLASENQVAAFSSIIADPKNLLGENRANILSLLANSWASNSGGWNVAVQDQAATSASTLSSVKIVPGSPIGLYGNTGPLPVLVENTLPYPVTVTLRLAPSNFRLVVQNEITITVEAASSKQAKVPMTRVTNGDTSVRIDLVTPTGVPISTEPTIVPVNVAADFEVAGSWLVGGIVALLLVFAAIRLFLKRRHGRTALQDGDTAETTEEQRD
ncbi:hypothetical protein ITJ38_16210 [Agreia pratensis]|uniref:DUF6049 family protein n=1 Tax=Agreia pratensis TaxID=150121 RepID=UPI00188A3912|nr:DUF6049 family protein [Agreia pratensis]MBF4635955.1 hypothetical protein [Agreia pratensis]